MNDSHSQDDFAALLSQAMDGGEKFRRFMAARPARNANAPKPESKPSANAAPLPAPEKLGEPSLKSLPDSDAVRDATGSGQLFESIHVPGLTDMRMGMNGFAIADLNRDGRPDLIATLSPPVSVIGNEAETTGGVERVSRSRAIHRLVVRINEGGFRFRAHAISIRGSTLTADEFGVSAQIPNLADFNGDGFLDIFVTRSSASLANKVRAGVTSLGNTLLLSDGTWDRFVDVSEKMGVRNEMGYNRQSSIGDVNGDGPLDLVFASDPDNTGIATDLARYESKVYWNTGEHSAKANHWLHLKFSGVKDAELIGARVELMDPPTANPLGTRWIHSNHSYKSGGALDAHFGLGQHKLAKVVVTLLDGRAQKFIQLAADKTHTLTINTP